MFLTASLLSAALAVLTQTAAPAPVDPATPPPAAAPGAEPVPAVDPNAAPAAAPMDAPPAAPANPAHWRVTRVEVAGATGTRQEVRVLRGDDTAVSLGEGLADIADNKRLLDRAARLDDSQTSWQAILGRVVVLCVGGILAVGGLAAAAAGGAFWAWSSAGSVPDANPQLLSVVQQGPSILLTGLIAAAIGAFTVVVTAGLWAWFILRGPPPADPAVVQALGSSLAWDEKEANEVVQKHNTAVDTAAQAPAAAPAPAPAPEAAPAPAPPADPAAPAPAVTPPPAS